MCHLHEAPFHLEASLDWAMTGGPWSEVAGPPVSWVTTKYYLVLCFGNIKTYKKNLFDLDNGKFIEY